MRTFRKVTLFLSLLWYSYGLAAGLSLHDKIGQMLIIGFEGQTINAHSPIVKAIRNNNIGGVILFDYNYHTHKFDKNIKSPAQVKALTKKLQQFNTTINQLKHRPNLPLFISVDYEGGNVNRLAEKYGFPKTYSAKVIGKMPYKKVRPIATTMANTLKKAGFNLNFAPVLDTEINSESPIIAKLERSFSADPNKVVRYSHLFSQQLLTHNLQCAYKHFPGHGSAATDSHLGFVDVTNTWHEQELIPFQQSLNKKTHCGMMMTAHIVNKRLDPLGLPATLSYKILTEILRGQLEFDGVIITDDMQMKAITDQYGLEKALTLAINAGADMFIFGNQLGTLNDPEKVVQIIEKKVAIGEIPLERINEAYQRILKLKVSMN